MTQARTQITTETAIGDGNCAFNSFILGFSTKKGLDQIERNLLAHDRDPDLAFAAFIQQTARAFKIKADWQTVKAKLLAERENNPNELQRKLAPIMRKLAIDQAEKDVDHLERTINPIQSAFNNFLGTRLQLSWAKKDDIFKEHSFINQKFTELYRLYHPNNELVEKIHRLLTGKSDEEIKQEKTEKADMMTVDLLAWWKDEGYGQFLQEMKKPRKWAGDLELSQLGAYFGVDIDVYRHGHFLHTIHSEHGAIPFSELTTDQQMQLQVRNVGELNQTRQELKLYRRTPEQLSKQLGAIPQAEKIIALITAAEDEGTPLSEIFFPAADEALKASTNELIARNVIARDTKTGKFKFTDLSYEEAKKRVEQVAGKDELLIIWRQYYQNTPTISLINNYGIHWNNGVVGAAPVKKPISQNSFYLDTLTQLRKKEITYDSQAHQALIAEAKKEARKIATGKEKEEKSNDKKHFIEYKLPSKEKITVSEETQMKLDEELAKQLQTEEYRKYKSSRKR